jgi:pilus assembly protein TadC
MSSKDNKNTNVISNKMCVHIYLKYKINFLNTIKKFILKIKKFILNFNFLNLILMAIILFFIILFFLVYICNLKRKKQVRFDLSKNTVKFIENEI